MDLLAAGREALQEAGSAHVRCCLRLGDPNGDRAGRPDDLGVVDLRAPRRDAFDGDVLWLLRDDVRLTAPAERCGGAVLRGAPVARYALALETPASRAHAEVWFDDLGRPVLASMAQALLPALYFQLYGRQLRRLVSGAFSTADRAVWQTTELWDFAASRSDARHDASTS